MFSEADLDAQSRLRRAFDPDEMANPGKVLPTGASLRRRERAQRCSRRGVGVTPQ